MFPRIICPPRIDYIVLPVMEIAAYCTMAGTLPLNPKSVGYGYPAYPPQIIRLWLHLDNNSMILVSLSEIGMRQLVLVHFLFVIMHLLNDTI